jgi:hypothetical protein
MYIFSPSASGKLLKVAGAGLLLEEFAEFHQIEQFTNHNQIQ